jgi:predicted DNA-binding transcriptional regulator AlpA
MQPEIQPTLLNKVAVCIRLSISKRTLEMMVDAGTFPPPVRLGKYVYWSEAAVSKWQRRLFAIQDAWEPR